MQDKTICILGCGNMGRSLIGGLIANGYPSGKLQGADPNEEQRRQTAGLFNISVSPSSQEAAKNADVIVLAVKPQIVQESLAEVRSLIQMNKALLISIAAGVRLETLSEIIGPDSPKIRVMPNTPSLFQAGASALYAETNVSQDDRDTAESIMRAVGVTVWLDDEAKLDAVTALSGSGPAYFFS